MSPQLRFRPHTARRDSRYYYASGKDYEFILNVHPPSTIETYLLVCRS